MAVHTILNISQLEAGYVLSPERYDPRRQVKSLADSKPLSDLAEIVSRTIQPSKTTKKLLVLDTSDVKEGLITPNKKLTMKIGSAKKIVQSGDVLISRLRPYLKQVGFVARQLENSDVQIVVSTEFFVLRAIDERSIAFLVPYLLTDPIQNALSASQEGGHHPRFDANALANLPIPKMLIKKRDVISKQIEQAAQMYIESSILIDSEIRKISKSIDC